MQTEVRVNDLKCHIHVPSMHVLANSRHIYDVTIWLSRTTDNSNIFIRSREVRDNESRLYLKRHVFVMDPISPDKDLCYTDKVYSIQWFCKCTVKAQIRLRGCAGWSGPSLSTYARKHVSTWRGPAISIDNEFITELLSKRTAKAQIRLCGCADWSGLRSPHMPEDTFPHGEAQL